MEHALRGARPGLRERPAHRPVLPAVWGLLYFLRPGTTKLPLFPALPLLGGTRRTWLDVTLYLALLVVLVRALLASELDAALLVPIVALVPLVGLADRTIFLALRAEHYWTMAVCFAFATNWIAGAKAVQLALWFWAGFSKLNHHFPSVVCVMTSNSPVLRFGWLRRRMYRHYPDDLRPSRLAEWMAHAGTALELTVPVVLLLSTGGPSLVVGMVMVLMLHGYITSNVPMGVPIEWNFAVVYGAFALFWAHPDVTLGAIGPLPLTLFLAVMLVGLPLAGNLFPGPRLLSARHALLRRELGLRGLALPRRELPEARQAHQERRLGLRPVGQVL